MSHLSDFQALLFDVDNTLNNSNKIITPATIEALHQLPPNLHQAVCTGRIFAALEQYVLPYFPANSVHIISGGAQLVTSTGEVLWEKAIPEETSRRLCALLTENQVEFLISQEKKMFATPILKEHLTKGPVPISLAHMADVPNWTTPLISIHHVTDKIRAITAQFPKLTVKEMATKSGDTYFDITAEGVNKASALDKWAEVTGVELSKTLGFGDSSNDLEFLQKIGFPVAMGNSIPELKAIAKHVIGDTDQEGLAVYLREITQGAEL